ncbi:MAG: hypothetical protein HY741_02430 [Chloroflexi bacterium]|nr:hypothetical protein [Chloroflexota bacterium]
MPPIPPTPNQFPQSIYGIHDVEGANFLQQNNCSGWLVHSVKVWSDASPDYTPLVNAGLRVLVRLNNGYGSEGTIPPPSGYDAFAQKCAEWVAQTRGAQLFILGNEMNISAERPNDGNGNSLPILPSDYASCFLKCRAAIQAKPGFANANLIPGATGPYNIETNYATNPTGDWIKYFQDVLAALQNQCDGIAIHCYSRGQNPGDVTNTDKFPAPYQNNFRGFLAYQNFMQAIPAAMRQLPVYLTETQPLINDAPNWLDDDTGWVRAVYTEINRWNSISSNQPIQALAMFRWLNTDPHWCFSTKPNVLNDFRAAIAQNFKLRLPGGAQPGQTLEQATLAAAKSKPWMPVNNTAALWKFAKANGLQDQQTDELSMTFNGEQYIVQVFNLGIVYVKVGDWGNIKVIPK